MGQTTLNVTYEIARRGRKKVGDWRRYNGIRWVPHMVSPALQAIVESCATARLLLRLIHEPVVCEGAADPIIDSTLSQSWVIGNSAYYLYLLLASVFGYAGKHFHRWGACRGILSPQPTRTQNIYQERANKPHSPGGLLESEVIVIYIWEGQRNTSSIMH